MPKSVGVVRGSSRARALLVSWTAGGLGGLSLVVCIGNDR